MFTSRFADWGLMAYIKLDGMTIDPPTAERIMDVTFDN
jgi:hypothetical protein